MSCGAALHHLRTALAACGEQAVVELMPFPGVLDVLARVAGRGRTEPDPVAVERLEAATRRRTIRMPFTPARVRTSAIDRVWEAARAEGAELHVMEDDVKRAALRLVTDGDHEQMGNPSFRRELAAWMHVQMQRRPDTKAAATAVSADAFRAARAGSAFPFHPPSNLRRPNSGLRTVDFGLWQIPRGQQSKFPMK